MNDDYDQDYDPDEQIDIHGKQLANTAFMKKKDKGILEVNRKEKQKEKGGKGREELQDSTSINVYIETINRKNLVSLNDIIDNKADEAVKPIIGNKDIEILESFNFNKNSLGFEYIDPDTLAEGIVNEEMKEELGAIFDGMVGDEKYNVLGYFESIIQNSDVANYLFKE